MDSEITKIFLSWLQHDKLDGKFNQDVLADKFAVESASAISNWKKKGIPKKRQQKILNLVDKECGTKGTSWKNLIEEFWLTNRDNRNDGRAVFHKSLKYNSEKCWLRLLPHCEEKIEDTRVGLPLRV